MLPLDSITAIQTAMPAMESAPPVPVIRDGASLESLGMSAVGSPEALPPAQPPNSFANLLDNLVTEVNTRQQHAKNVIQQMESGGNVPLHRAVIAMEEANVSFQLMVEVRNKLLEAYTEIMRMQV